MKSTTYMEFHLKVITLPQRGRLDGCEPSQRRPFGFILKFALILFTVQLFLMGNVLFYLVQLKANS
jgi:hypothetical protein